MRRFVPGLPTRLLTVACPSWLLTGKKTSRTSLRTARFSVSSASLQMPNTSQVRRWLASLRPRPTFCRRFARVVSHSVALLATSMLDFRDLPISWILPVAGAGIGAAAGWVESSQLSPSSLARRVSDTRLDVVRVRFFANIRPAAMTSTSLVVLLVPSRSLQFSVRAPSLLH